MRRWTSLNLPVSLPVNEFTLQTVVKHIQALCIFKLDSARVVKLSTLKKRGNTSKMFTPF